jgi:hypothetical protein
VATRDVVQTFEPGQQMFVTAVATGFFLRERKRGETFSVPVSLVFNEDGSIKGKRPTWFVPASEGDVQRAQEAVEEDMARAHASPRYQPANSPEAVRAANAARADSAKAAEPREERTETVEQKAARLQAEQKAAAEQTERTSIEAEETARRNREDAKAGAQGTTPAARTTPEDAERQADASIRIGKLREEASKLEAEGSKDSKRKAQSLREEANKLEQGSDLA